MDKDIIYIDTEDDITAIIGKIKSSKDKIVALVPPKRTGVLQSAVNLRLLARAAKQDAKHLVIITHNQALSTLAATAKIPVAKTLQSKPEIPQIDALDIDDGEDIIEGSKLPVGDLVKTIDHTQSDNRATEAAMSTIDIDSDSPETIRFSPQIIDNDKASDKKKKTPKVPDISKFRKKIFLGGGGALILIIFLVWANVFAPAATILITAKTATAPVSATLNLVGNTSTDTSKNNVQTVTKTITKALSVDFTPTGDKILGHKARGTITLSNAYKSNSISVPAGSIFSNGNYNFMTTASVSVPGAQVVAGKVAAGTISTNIVAVEVGPDYNLPAAQYTSGIDNITATASATSGGDNQQATIVTADDISKATDALKAQATDSYKKQLLSQFNSGEKVITDSFTVTYDKTTATPAENGESTNGKATLSSSVTLKVTAIAKSELKTYLKYYENKQITNTKTQKIYDDGMSTVKLTNYSAGDDGSAATVNLSATGQVGPNVDEALVKQAVKGKNYGDAQAALSSIDGVNNVDVKFSYFWVTKIPTNTSKISVQFSVQK